MEATKDHHLKKENGVDQMDIERIQEDTNEGTEMQEDPMPDNFLSQMQEKEAQDMATSEAIVEHHSIINESTSLNSTLPSLTPASSLKSIGHLSSLSRHENIVIPISYTDNTEMESIITFIPNLDLNCDLARSEGDCLREYIPSGSNHYNLRPQEKKPSP